MSLPPLAEVRDDQGYHDWITDTIARETQDELKNQSLNAPKKPNAPKASKKRTGGRRRKKTRKYKNSKNKKRRYSIKQKRKYVKRKRK